MDLCSCFPTWLTVWCTLLFAIRLWTTMLTQTGCQFSNRTLLTTTWTCEITIKCYNLCLVSYEYILKSASGKTPWRHTICCVQLDIWYSLRYCARNCLQGLRKTTKNILGTKNINKPALSLFRNSQSLGQ